VVAEAVEAAMEAVPDPQEAVAEVIADHQCPIVGDMSAAAMRPKLPIASEFSASASTQLNGNWKRNFPNSVPSKKLLLS